MQLAASDFNRSYSSKILCLLFVGLCAVAAVPKSEAATENSWTRPVLLWSGAVSYPSISADGTRVAAVETSSGVDDYHRNIRVIENTAGSWQPPVTIGSNGICPADPSRAVPQKTHPVISGNGNVVAYLGATGQGFPNSSTAIYVSDRLNGTWSAPYVVGSGLESYHNMISISADGNTIAFSSNPFMAAQHVFICTRSNSQWTAHVPITDSAIGGAFPSLTADGNRIVFISNAQLWSSERSSGGWSAPSALTSNDWIKEAIEYPRISSDGLSVFFWRIPLVAQGGMHLRSAQDLYVIRREGAGWKTPARITTTPIALTPGMEGLPAIDASGSHAIYARPVRESGVTSGSFLELEELFNDHWLAPFPLTTYGGYGTWERSADLSGDGKTLVYAGNNGLMHATLASRRQSDFIGTWAAGGVYSRDSSTGAWNRLASAATKISAGDVDGDGIDELIGIWPYPVEGIWIRYSTTGPTPKIGTYAESITVGDMNGDGRVDVVASWPDDGVYFRDSITGLWTSIAPGASQIATGDLDGDGADDLIGVWPSWGGLCVLFSKTGEHQNISSAADSIACGDINGDGIAEVIRSWKDKGVYYYTFADSTWHLLASYATQIITGDLDGDGIDDLIGIWPSTVGAWVKYSHTGQWAKLSTSTPDWIAVGKLRPAAGPSSTSSK